MYLFQIHYVKRVFSEKAVMPGKVEEKRRAARWMESVMMVMGPPFGDQAKEIIIEKIVSMWSLGVNTDQ